MQYCRKVILVLVTTALTLSAVFALPASKGSDDKPQGNVQGGEQSNHSHVIIVGAGLAGVAAASRLMGFCLNVTILEAENRLGGRVDSVPFGGTVVDIGAQWVNGIEGNVIYEMAAPLGLLQSNVTSLVDNMEYLQANGQFSDHGILNHLWNTSEEILGEAYHTNTNNNGSVGQYFLEKFAAQTAVYQNTSADLVQKFLNWYEKVAAFSDGADSWLNVSIPGELKYWETPGDQNIVWKNNGFYSVIDLLTKRYPKPEEELPVRQNTHFNTEVKSINWGQNRVVGPNGQKVVLVEDSNGGRYTADIVLVTVSLGVLKERATTMFNPPLPSAKMNAIRNIGFGQVDKIFLNFAESWWPRNITGYSILVTPEDRLRFNRQYPEYSDKGEWLYGLAGLYLLPGKQPQPVLMGWLVGEPARNMENYSDDQVMLGSIRWLEMFANRSLPQPISVTRSKWWSNPHFRGSFSHRSLDSEMNNALPAHLAEPLSGPDDRPEVLFAGEATSDHHYSTAHGAIETGWREANRILNLLSVCGKIPEQYQLNT